MFFFFQAEDGIRDHCVTGVQTCALPICARRRRLARQARLWSLAGASAALAMRELLSTRRGHAPARLTLMSWCALQAAMLDWHLGMVEGLDGELRTGLSVADALTLGRGA